MTPHYSFWKCDGCDKAFRDAHCLGDGKYCAKEVKSKRLSGREILLEDLRELCVYKEAYKTLETRHLWWDYIAATNSECSGTVSEPCSQSAHRLTGLDFDTTKKCVEESFSKSSADSNGWRDSSVTNSLMEPEVKEYQQYKDTEFPLVVVNG